MVFPSLVFLIFFLPLVIISVWCAKKISVKNFLLLLFSLLFYAWGEPTYIVLLLFSILVNYLLAILIEKSNTKSKKVVLLILCVLFNLAAIGYFKYSNFLLFNLNRVFGTNFYMLYIPSMPIGISFFTFQILSYVIDVYREKVKVQKNILTQATYIIFFPQLVAGPIVRYETIEEELRERHVTLDDLFIGCKRFVLGLSKKVLLANQMAMIVDTIYNSQLQEMTTILLWIAAISYTFQIYFDFSGYSDMAIGIGRMLGFHFNENFNFPYMANSIKDFWRRWHISLSSWFKDYVYIPLGGNRVGNCRWIFNVLIVWGLTGLWHGAAWNFILWGLYYGILLILETFIFKNLKMKPNILYRMFVLFLIVLGWVFFRVEGSRELILVINKMFIFDGIGFIESIKLFPALLFNYIFLPIALICSIKWKYEIKNINVQSLILVFLYVISFISILSSSYNPFIYFRF